MSAPVTSRTLLQRLCQQSHPRDWERFDAVYRPFVLAVATRRYRLAQEDAEEVCQEVLIAVRLHLNRFDRARPFSPWLRSIIYRKSLDLIRRQNRQQGRSQGHRTVSGNGPDGQDRLAVQPDPGDLTEETALNEILGNILERLRTEQPAGYFAAFHGSFFAGKTDPELAQELNTSEANVAVRRSRVLQRFRQLWSEALEGRYTR